MESIPTTISRAITSIPNPKIATVGSARRKTSPHFTRDRRVLIVANGSGLGHITRALALARRFPSPVTIIANEAPPKVIAENTTILATTNEREILRTIRRHEPGPIVIDTFPRGLRGELTQIMPHYPGPRILLARVLNPRYWKRCNVADFIERHYDFVFVLMDPAGGVGFPPNISGYRVNPITILSRNEVLSRRKAREVLGIRRNEFVVYNPNGDPIPRAIRSRMRAPLRDIRGEEAKARYPFMRYLRAVDLAVTGCGYNTFHELVLCRIPAIFIPRKRKYDLQEERAKRVDLVKRWRVNGADQIARILYRDGPRL
ncbi:MAG: hypothetical protein D6679_09785 [Candidatus Hydrogenedentota bacterium]|nr:MAG: hypothetical protein D6679_09785 [Candidatus Hydrogenedentota bacterium]